MTGKEIVRQVCEELQILEKEFFGPWRYPNLVEARKEAVARMKQAGFSNAKAGRCIGRDRSTVTHYLHPEYLERKRIRERRRGSAECRA